MTRAGLVNAGLTADDCKAAIKLEWRVKDKTQMWPGMPAEKRKAISSNVGHIRALDRVWRVVCEFLEGDGNVSGRLYMDRESTDNGSVRVVRTRGIRRVVDQYQDIPTLIMDATLPSKELLQLWFPTVEIVGNIELPMPHVRVRQILGAPITKKKLVGDERHTPAGWALGAIRRYILRRWVETGRNETLVICQKEVEEALSGLPDNIHLARYRHVRLLITVGRTLPKLFDVEATASLLSGIELKSPRDSGAVTWFDRVERGIRIKGGGGVAVLCDQHPDPLAEAVRWQVCKAELLQAIGRGRGVNRSAPGDRQGVDGASPSR